MARYACHLCVENVRALRPRRLISGFWWNPDLCNYFGTEEYFFIHERSVIPKYSTNLAFYTRYIDDGNAIWIPCADPAEDDARWFSFQRDINNFGSLTWEFSSRATDAVFLDLSISIELGKIVCTMHEKKLNLYLYIPPHSAHPPGVLLSLIAGRLASIYRLTTRLENRRQLFRLFVQRLRVRGYQRSQLKPLFEKCLRQLPGFFSANSTTAATIPIAPSRAADSSTTNLYAHVIYHPKNPPNRRIQRAFEHFLRNPSDETSLDDLRNHSEIPFGPSRLVIANHRPFNLKNILSPRKLRPGATSTAASAITDEIRPSLSDETGGAPNPDPPFRRNIAPRRRFNPILDLYRKKGLVSG